MAEVTSEAGDKGSAGALAKRLRRLRQERGWSQAKLSGRLGLHQKQISLDDQVFAIVDGIPGTCERGRQRFRPPAARRNPAKMGAMAETGATARSQKLDHRVSGYERGVHVPSTELLIRIAELFKVSLDYLAFDDRDDVGLPNVGDVELLQRFEAVDKLSVEDKATIKGVLDAFILKSRFQQLAAGGQST